MTRDRSIIVKKILDNPPPYPDKPILPNDILHLEISNIKYHRSWKYRLSTYGIKKEKKNPRIEDLTTCEASSKSRRTRAGNSLQDKSTRLEISRFTWANKKTNGAGLENRRSFIYDDTFSSYHRNERI